MTVDVGVVLPLLAIVAMVVSPIGWFVTWIMKRESDRMLDVAQEQNDRYEKLLDSQLSSRSEWLPDRCDDLLKAIGEYTGEDHIPEPECSFCCELLSTLEEAQAIAEAFQVEASHGLKREEVYRAAIDEHCDSMVVLSVADRLIELAEFYDVVGGGHVDVS